MDMRTRSYTLGELAGLLSRIIHNDGVDPNTPVMIAVTLDQAHPFEAAIKNGFNIEVNELGEEEGRQNVVYLTAGNVTGPLPDEVKRIIGV